ncbi:MAG: ABC transporter permease [Thermoproteota archaeon]
MRTISVLCTLVIAIYIIILVVNLGGFVDQIVTSQLRQQIYETIMETQKHLPLEERRKMAEELLSLEIKRLGFDKPFLYRSFIYLKNALIWDFGRSFRITSSSGSKTVALIILERLGPTILLFTSLNVIIFLSQLFGGLIASRHYGKLADRIVTYSAPLSSVPGWFYGIFVILIFSAWLRLLPFSGMLSIPPPEDPLLKVLDIAWHMIGPTISWFIAYLPIGIYYYRTFFLIFSKEDYVELAYAKGLPQSLVERRYILRPALPPIITSFALIVIGSWTGAIITETVFGWPGMGRLLYEALQAMDSPVLLATSTIYAYLLAITVIVLDVVYMVVDPRVRLT